MIQSGLDISRVITHRFTYTQFKESIELMKSGNSGKIVLDWSERWISDYRLPRAAKPNQSNLGFSLTGRAGFPACSFATRQDARLTRQARCLCYLSRRHMKNLLKLATASSSCGELRKLSSKVVRISRIPRLPFRAKSRNLSILFPIMRLDRSPPIPTFGSFFLAALDLIEKFR